MSAGSSTTWLYYVDESYDRSKFCLIALGLKASTWKQAFDQVKTFRTNLNSTYGIFVGKELHAREFTKGNKRIGKRTVTKWERSRIFMDALRLIAALPDAHMFNICLDQKGRADPQLDAWDRLLNRLNRTCEERNKQELSRRRELLDSIQTQVGDAEFEAIEKRLMPYSSQAVLIADQGREVEIVRLRRRLTVYNHIPSMFGQWSSGPTKNIPLNHFVEDTFFKSSAHSYFIQLADFAAYALLKREVPPTSHVNKYGLQKGWDLHLASVSFKAASSRDPFGIVRK